MSLNRTILILLSFLTIGVVFSWAYFSLYTNRPAWNLENFKISPTTVDLIAQKKSGDYTGTLKAFEELQKNPDISKVEKLYATVIVTGSKFRSTGNIEDLVKDIRNLKAMAFDTDLKRTLRANAINTLAGLYKVSGNNSLVFEEIFKDRPLSSYVVAGSPDDSLHNLYEWSYSLRPTAVAAIHISEWYLLQQILHPELDEATKQKNIRSAEQYLRSADDDARVQLDSDATFASSGKYLDYRLVKTRVIGQLSQQLGAPYLEQYKKEYEDFIAYAQQSENLIAKESAHFARFSYGLRSAHLKDEETARQQLDLLAEELGPVVNSDTDTFVLFVRSQKIRNTENWEDILAAEKVSEKFKASIDAIIAAQER